MKGMPQHRGIPIFELTRIDDPESPSMEINGNHFFGQWFSPRCHSERMKNLSMNRNQLEINFFANEFLLHAEWKGENLTLENVEWFLPQTQTEIE